MKALKRLFARVFGFMRKRNVKLALTTYQPSHAKAEVVCLGGSVSVPVKAIAAQPAQKERGVWERPEFGVGRKVYVFSPPHERALGNCIAYGRIMSRGARRARVRTDDGQSYRRSVKNLVAA